MNLQRPLNVRLEVHIDRLALRALPPGGEQRLNAAVEVELNRLIANEALGLRPARHRPRAEVRPRLSGPQPTLQACAREIAATIHRAIRSS